jgi:hypothetical protein
MPNNSEREKAIHRHLLPVNDQSARRCSPTVRARWLLRKGRNIPRYRRTILGCAVAFLLGQRFNDRTDRRGVPEALA